MAPGRVDSWAALCRMAVSTDGRQYFMEGPGGNARSGHVPVDDDNDGLIDEDPPEDINGNGRFDDLNSYFEVTLDLADTTFVVTDVSREYNKPIYDHNDQVVRLRPFFNGWRKYRIDL